MMELRASVTNPRTTSGYGVYDVRLTGHGVEVTSVRRFTEFYLAIRSVRARFGRVPPPPPKKRFGNGSASLLKDRCGHFQNCVTAIMKDKRARTHPKFRELIGFFEWKERVLALTQTSLIVLRGLFRSWASFTVKRQHKKTEQKLSRDLDEAKSLVSAVRRLTGAGSSEPVSSLESRLTADFDNLDKKRQVEGTRASSTESSVIHLCSEMFAHECHSTASALVAIREGVKKLQEERDANSGRVSESESKLRIIDELIAVAKEIRSSGTIVPEDALFIIQEELVNSKNEIRELKLRAADVVPPMPASPPLDIAEISKQVALNPELNSNRFGIEKATLTSFEEKKRKKKTVVMYSIEVTTPVVGKKWIVQRRFNSFRGMRKRLGDSAKGISFPGTMTKNPEKRLDQLNIFMAAMIERAKRGDSKIAAEVASFLSDEKQQEEGFESDDSYDSLNGSIRPYSPQASPKNNGVSNPSY